MAHRARGVCALLVAGFTTVTLPAQGRPGPDGVLERVGVYAERFGRDLQGIVARERYVQTIRATRGRPSDETDGLEGQVREERRLLSSVLLVHEAATPWQLHRDVLAVDGQPVADREDRLAQLFGGPAAGRREAPGVIADESARYNLGVFIRNINVPTFPLIVVHPTHRARFRFRDRGVARVDALAVRVLAFEERARPRIIRGTRPHDVVLKGTLAVDEGTGELVHATVAPTTRRLEVRLDVRFGRVAGVPLRVPVRLVERYWRPGSDTYVAGDATYDDFRRYTTDVGMPVIKEPPG